MEALQELEQLLQANTNISTDNPPGFHGDRNMIHSPETMSVNSDICSHHMDSGLEDDDNLSVNHGDVNGEQASGFQNNKEEFSLENALFSVAAKAKKFAEERQKSKSSILRLPSFRRKSAYSPTRETEKDEKLSEERKDSERKGDVTNDGPYTEELTGKADSSASEMSPGVLRKTGSSSAVGSDGAVELSDENEAKDDQDVLQDNGTRYGLSEETFHTHWKNRVFSRSWKFRLPTNFHDTSNKFPYHGSVQKVGSVMDIYWKSQ